AADKLDATTTPLGFTSWRSTSLCSPGLSGHQIDASMNWMLPAALTGTSTVPPDPTTTLDEKMVPLTGRNGRPAPLLLSNRAERFRPELIMTELMKPGAARPKNSHIRAVAPAALGVAALVPVNSCSAVSDTLLAANTFVGPRMSGLTRPSDVGPRPE